MITHLILGDVHVKPGISNERLLWAGRLALDRRPDVIICMGDFGDMESLCSYDMGKKDFEGRRYDADVKAVHDALNLFNKPFFEYNEVAKVNKKAQYKPRRVLLGGNHDEGRINRVIQLHPELAGTVKIEDLQYKEAGWEYIPFRTAIEIDGIHYCHYFASGVKGEPIGGFTVASQLLAKNLVSSTVGHNHIFDFAMRAKPTGEKCLGLSTGCYMEHRERYAEPMDHLWWRGLIVKNNVQNGFYDLEQLSIQRVKELYG